MEDGQLQDPDLDEAIDSFLDWFHEEMPSAGTPGWAYVLIGHKDKTARVPFDVLCAELERAACATREKGA